MFTDVCRRVSERGRLHPCLPDGSLGRGRGENGLDWLFVYRTSKPPR